MSNSKSLGRFRLHSPRIWSLVGLALAYAILVKVFPYLLQATGFQFELFSLAYPWSFTPLLAVGIFTGAVVANRRAAMGAMLAALVGSDLLIWALTGHASWAVYPLLPAIYACLLATTWLGYAVRDERTAWKPLGAGLAAAVLYFLVTNGLSWMIMPEYTKDASGLVACFTAALPFFRNMLLGTAFYTAILFSPVALRFAYPEEANARFLPQPQEAASAR